MTARTIALQCVVFKIAFSLLIWPRVCFFFLHFYYYTLLVKPTLNTSIQIFPLSEHKSSLILIFHMLHYKS